MFTKAKINFKGDKNAAINLGRCQTYTVLTAV